MVNVAGRPNITNEVLEEDGTFTSIWYRFMEQLWVRSGGSSDGIAESAPTGEIKAFGGSSAPTNYLLCDGSAVSRLEFDALFTVIGTIYGVGDGSTTFNLPDGQGRVLVGAGAGSGLTSRSRGDEFGEEDHLQTIAEMPVHDHGITDPGHTHSVTDPGHAHSETSGNFVNDAAGTEYDNTNGDKGTTNANTASATTGVTVDSATTGVTVGNEGGGNAFNVIQPSFVANYIIKT